MSRRMERAGELWDALIANFGVSLNLRGETGDLLSYAAVDSGLRPFLLRHTELLVSPEQSIRTILHLTQPHTPSRSALLLLVAELAAAVVGGNVDRARKRILRKLRRRNRQSKSRNRQSKSGNGNRNGDGDGDETETDDDDDGSDDDDDSSESDGSEDEGGEKKWGAEDVHRMLLGVAGDSVLTLLGNMAGDFPLIKRAFGASSASLRLASELAVGPVAGHAIRLVLFVPELVALARTAKNPLLKLSAATGIPYEVIATRVLYFLLPAEDVMDPDLVDFLFFDSGSSRTRSRTRRSGSGSDSSEEESSGMGRGGGGGGGGGGGRNHLSIRHIEYAANALSTPLMNVISLERAGVSDMLIPPAWWTCEGGSARPSDAVQRYAFVYKFRYYMSLHRLADADAVFH